MRILTKDYIFLPLAIVERVCRFLGKKLLQRGHPEAPALGEGQSRDDDVLFERFLLEQKSRVQRSRVAKVILP